VPFCQSHCPLHNNIPDWLKLTAEGRLREAYELSQATNTFPEICGRICPQDRLCEGNCVIEQSGHGTVTIGAVEKYLTDTAFEEGWVEPIRPLAERPESVGILGAGPAGLAAADRLRRIGFQVTIYDRHDRAGGLLTYGIPGFKLEKEVVMRRNAQLQEAGVKFVHDCDVGETISFAELRENHDAVLIATGVYKSRDLGGPGSGVPGIVQAIDYLTASNRKGFGDDVPEFDSGELNAEGKRVVVIGGGDTAMDCVRTSVRLGAAEVICVYRRTEVEMPGNERDRQFAKEEGVEFHWLTQPVRLIGDDEGRVAAMECIRMELGEPDDSGRRRPLPIEGSEFTMEVDTVISALGYWPDPLLGEKTQDLATHDWGLITIDEETGATSRRNVFAGGDDVLGPNLVVTAVAQAKVAAKAMHEYLMGLPGKVDA
jgi:glutamate synthase (NADPH/NADH) small chain